jgi:hypothetical protein
MLPTLLGRLQTRLLLILCIGLPVTAVYSVWLANRAPVTGPTFPPWIKSFGQVTYDIRPVQILCLLLLVGVSLDVVYQGLQKFRWDRDWPFAFQFFVSIGEFAIVLALIGFDVFPFMPARWIGTGEYPYFVLYFALVFIPSFIALLGFIQIFMVRWRYKGGEWGRS